MRSVVVLPTFNERDNIERYVRALRAAAPEVDLLVVDDDSPDGTAAAARSLAAQYGGVEVVVRTQRRGLGEAYRDGFARALAAGYEAIVSMDADLSHDPVVIPVMLSLLADGADVVVGSRYVDGGGTANWPIHRRLLSSWGNRYTRSVLRIGVRDCTSGFRAYRADALRRIDPQSTRAEGYAFLTEIIRRADGAGMRIVETPITFIDRTAGTSKMSGRIIAESMWRVTRWALTGRRLS